MSSKRKYNLELGNTVMIGRQNLHVKKSQLEECLQRFNYTSNPDTLLNSDHSFAEELLKTIGAKEVDSIDASDYEEATIIQDLNTAIPSSLNSRFDFTLDSGSLEHIFNVPVALKSYLNMTKKGGYYVGIYPCNNFFGHGFYQFSSELFYRTLSADNGFEIMDMILFVDEPNTNFYSVPDTSEQFTRVQFTNCKPVYIYVIARKIDDKEVFASYPQQMDYAALKWQGNRPIAKRSVKKKSPKNIIPKYFKNIVKAIFNKIDRDDSVHFKKPFLTQYNLK